MVDAINRLNIFPSLFPMHTFYWGDWHRDHTVGPALADTISPTGWMMERGMMFSSHHDAPVVSVLVKRVCRPISCRRAAARWRAGRACA